MTDDTPEETKRTLEYIGSIVGGIILLLTFGLIFLATTGTASLSGIPEVWFMTVIFPIIIMAAIQVFGEDVYNVFKKNQD